MEIVIKAEKNQLSVVVDGEPELEIRARVGWLMGSSDFEEQIGELFEGIKGKVVEVVQGLDVKEAKK